MYTRFYNSIISPRNIVNYRTDSLFRVFLYILFFAVLLSTRITIDTITFDGIGGAVKESMISEFETVDQTCIIEDAVFTCATAESTLVYQDVVIGFYTDSFDNFNSSVYSSDGYAIILHGDSLHFVVSGTELMTIPISELSEEFQQLDFSTQDTDPTYFYATIFDAADEYLMSIKTYWGTGMIIIDFLTNFTMFMIFILVSAWMLRMRFKVIKFKHLFVMTAYSSTALYLILILNSLYSLSFFIIVIMLIVAFRQNSQLSVELYRRLNKKP